MKKINKELKLGECQEHRIWLHSNTLGYGKWISTIHIVSIIKTLSTKHNNDFKKVPLTPETPRVFGYQCPKCKEIVGRCEIKNHVCSEPI